MKRLGLAAAAILLLTACTKPVAPPPSPVPAVNPSALQVVREFPGVSALPAWSGTRILFHDAQQRPTIADVVGNGAPQAVSQMTAFSALAWSPDGKSIVFAGPRSDTATLYMQAVDGGEPVDLLPGAQAKHGMTGAKLELQWLDPATLAYKEHMGTGVGDLWLVNINTRQLLPMPDKHGATFFTWAPDSTRVAGVWDGPAPFWVYDFRESQFLKPTAPLPGERQWFEDWLDRDRCLFTAWDGFPYQDNAATPTLYLWNLADGSVTKFADHAYMARAAGGLITYVTRVPNASLVVADANGVLWQEALGDLPDGPNIREYQPQMNERYVLYRPASGEWYVSPVAQRQPILVHDAEPQVSAGLSPNGRFLAVLEQTTLQILALP